MQAKHIRRLYERQRLDGCQVVNMAAHWWDAAGITLVFVIKLNTEVRQQVTEDLSTLIAPVFHSVCLVKVKGLEAVKKEVAKVLIQVSCKYPPVQAV